MNKYITIAIFLVLFAVTSITACGGYGSDNQPKPPVAPAAPTVNVDAGLKQLIFGWGQIAGATHYRLFENPDGNSGFMQIGDDIPADTLSVLVPIAVHLHDFADALYFV